MAEVERNPRNNMVAALLGLHAQTALHPGSGSALGTVDLPVQRERHTQWPTIPGSTLKGILRDACREQVRNRKGKSRDAADGDPDVVIAFGPPTGEDEKHAGALSLTDARLLAFPVRSLKGLFAWVTCPAILDRLARDTGLIRTSIPWKVPPALDNNTARVAEDSPCLIDKGTRLVLEEFEFARTGDLPGPVATWIAEHLLPEMGHDGNDVFAATKERFPRHLVLLSDDDFTHFARHATEVTARIGLNYETKTVKKGALFYQEFLPAETLFYSVVLANASRSSSNVKSAGDVLGTLRTTLPPILQIGGDETTGKGLCATHLWIANL
jgi:CRISPR-associated protein Cmr4